MPRKLLATLAAATLLMTGCGPEESGGSYSDVEALRDAYIEAGEECDDWEQSNAVGGAAQSGNCGMGAVLSTYLTHDAVQDRIAETKDSMFAEATDDWLTGENWIINGSDAEKLREQMGGQIVSFSGSDD